MSDSLLFFYGTCFLVFYNRISINFLLIDADCKKEERASQIHRHKSNNKSGSINTAEGKQQLSSSPSRFVFLTEVMI